ncbi:hypothetical protein BKH10_07595 [Actinomyces naeslundii]|nr:hypothetical protein BKH10_07595 [Actinomyces naeslundii]
MPIRSYDTCFRLSVGDVGECLDICVRSAGHTKVCWFSWQDPQETATVLTEHNPRLSPWQPARRHHRIAGSNDFPMTPATWRLPA